MKRQHFFTAALLLSLLSSLWAADPGATPRPKGTIPLQPGLTKAAQLSQARLGIEGAIQAASRLQQGKVIKAELEEENGFLVWEVEIITEGAGLTELLLDAGDGTLLERKTGNQ